MIRSVHRYADRASPELASEIRGFAGQEGRHAQAHERFTDVLRKQGVDVEPIVETCERVVRGGLERFAPPQLCLAVTAAAERFTAIVAQDVLGSAGAPFEDPEVRRLMQWHALEELEHKAVAFDVLQAVAPGYLLRAAGMALAAPILGGIWFWTTRHLCAQKGMSLLQLARELASVRDDAERTGKPGLKPLVTGVFLRGIFDYLRPGFHPMDHDDTELIASTLDRLTREGVIAASAE